MHLASSGLYCLISPFPPQLQVSISARPSSGIPPQLHVPTIVPSSPEPHVKQAK